MAEEFSRPSATPLVRRATVRSHTPMTPGRHSALRESSSLGDLVNVTNTEEVCVASSLSFISGTFACVSDVAG